MIKWPIRGRALTAFPVGPFHMRARGAFVDKGTQRNAAKSDLLAPAVLW